MFTGQSTFIPVFRVEADDIMMGFYLIEVFVLVVVAVQLLTFRCKREWITVQTVQIIFFSQYQIARYFNQGGIISTEMKNEIRKSLRDIYEMKYEVMKMAGDFRGSN